jgi:adenylate cyclase
MRRGLSLLALAVVALLSLELGVFHLMKPLENRLLDAFVKRHAASLAPDPDVVLVNIDEKSLVRMDEVAGTGRFPWPRVVYGTLIDGLAAQRPRAIVFDILFSEPDRVRPESDQEFVKAALRHGNINIYYPMVRLDSPHGARASQLAPLLGLVRGPGADPDARIAVVPPLVLPQKLWRTGTINFDADEDGVGRRYELRKRIGGWDLPSLPARVAMDLGFPLPDSDDLVLVWRAASEKLPRVSFSDLYEDFERTKRMRPADEFTGKIVVIGAAAPGLGDLRATPLSYKQPGHEILATAIENLKNGRAMRYAHPAWPAAIGITLVLLLYFAFHRGVDVRASGAALAVVTALLVAGQWLLVGRLTLLPLLTPLAAAWTFYAAAALGEYLRARRERQQAIAQFSRFTNPHVARQLVERGGIETGRREVTLLFSDIRGFTTLSETRKPEEVIALLNRYFSLQVDVVFRHGGSLDKFIGDCIMAIWGAPLDDPDHARRAVACALDMADTLQAFKRELGAENSDFDVGIGLHSGPAVVGLMGSLEGTHKRLEYTAIGDTVNLASRIEGLTKDAKRRILVSRDTVELCGDAFDFVSCGTFPVKGRAQPVELFEPKRKS